MAAKLFKQAFCLHLLVLVAFGVFAQHKNPFQTIGKKGKIVTLTNEKYEELFDQDSIQQIGSVLVNIRQMEIERLLPDDCEAGRYIDNSIASRFLSVDPLARNFAWNSPYAYAENSPIKFIDLDGAEKYDPSFKPTGITHVQLATVPIAPQDANFDYSIKAGPYNLYPISDPSGKRNAYWLARYTYTDGPYAGMHRDDWIVGTDGVGNFVKNGKEYYNKAGWLERFGGADQQFNVKSMLDGWKEVVTNPINWIMGASIYAGAMSAPLRATVSRSATNEYRATFLAAHPEVIADDIIVHHAVEQQVLTRYPGLFTESEIHSLQNLRGIPKSVNSEVHLSAIRKEWNAFYRANPNATREQILERATSIDLQYGVQFNPALKAGQGTGIPAPPIDPRNTQKEEK